VVQIEHICAEPAHIDCVPAHKLHVFVIFMGGNGGRRASFSEETVEGYLSASWLRCSLLGRDAIRRSALIGPERTGDDVPVDGVAGGGPRALMRAEQVSRAARQAG